jgi:hypothetical protein
MAETHDPDAVETTSDHHTANFPCSSADSSTQRHGVSRPPKSHLSHSPLPRPTLADATDHLESVDEDARLEVLPEDDVFVDMDTFGVAVQATVDMSTSCTQTDASGFMSRGRLMALPLPSKFAYDQTGVRKTKEAIETEFNNFNTAVRQVETSHDMQAVTEVTTLRRQQVAARRGAVASQETSQRARLNTDIATASDTHAREEGRLSVLYQEKHAMHADHLQVDLQPLETQATTLDAPFKLELEEESARLAAVLADVETKHQQTLEELDSTYQQTRSDLDVKYQQRRTELDVKHLEILTDADANRRQTLEDLDVKHASAARVQVHEQIETIRTAAAQQSAGLQQAETIEKQNNQETHQKDVAEIQQQINASFSRETSDRELHDRENDLRMAQLDEAKRLSEQQKLHDVGGIARRLSALTPEMHKHQADLYQQFATCHENLVCFVGGAGGSDRAKFYDDLDVEKLKQPDDAMAISVPKRNAGSINTSVPLKRANLPGLIQEIWDLPIGSDANTEVVMHLWGRHQATRPVSMMTHGADPNARLFKAATDPTALWRRCCDLPGAEQAHAPSNAAQPPTSAGAAAAADVSLLNARGTLAKPKPKPSRLPLSKEDSKQNYIQTMGSTNPGMCRMCGVRLIDYATPATKHDAHVFEPEASQPGVRLVLNNAVCICTVCNNQNLGVPLVTHVVNRMNWECLFRREAFLYVLKRIRPKGFPPRVFDSELQWMATATDEEINTVVPNWATITPTTTEVKMQGSVSDDAHADDTPTAVQASDDTPAAVQASDDNLKRKYDSDVNDQPMDENCGAAAGATPPAAKQMRVTESVLPSMETVSETPPSESGAPSAVPQTQKCGRPGCGVRPIDDFDKKDRKNSLHKWQKVCRRCVTIYTTCYGNNKCGPGCLAPNQSFCARDEQKVWNPLLERTEATASGKKIRKQYCLNFKK